ncbi:MAG TPA: glucan biosynthesis protein G [Verrucomicrobiae bacterium]|nr:glucan biosynthesis protein G [Verrucomicrobiae bacterium]
MLKFTCLILTAGILSAAVPVLAESAEVNLDYVAQRALERAQKPFHSPRMDLPRVLRQDSLNYDKYREIRFRRDKALWAADDLPFRVEFFHPGYLYQEPVHVNEFNESHVQPIRFSQDFFDYGKLTFQNEIPANTGYAGFRILYPLNVTNRWDELGAFLGASYFRLLGTDLHYGLSARGLALNCGEMDRPEEFPIFTDWWLGKPDKNAKTLKLYALLDSVSCTGAYEFQIDPGNPTVCDVNAVLYFRERKNIDAVNTNQAAIKTVGFAPLTSMFWFGKNSERKFDDYRSEVHDSDGLLVQMGNGEEFWRPLDNPSTLQHQVFYAPNIRGFGLLQRERNFQKYQDSFNLYQCVPSVWIKPKGNWGEGSLHLVELSTTYEGLDNIVAFWSPKEQPAPLQPLRFGYTMFWQGAGPDEKLSENRVISTRIGLDYHYSNTRQFIIDFAGPDLNKLPKDAPVKAISNCSTNAVIVEDQVLPPTDFLKAWRVILKMQPKPGNSSPVDLRCTLQNGTNILSETWVYQWTQP